MKLRKYSPLVILLVVCIVLSAGYLGRAQVQEGVGQTPEQSSGAQSVENVSQESQGIPGEPTESAIVNFSKLASEEARWPIVYKEPKEIREPGPGPRRKTVSVEAGAVMQEQEPQAYFPGQPLLPSPAPAASFKALEDNNVSIPPDTHGAVGPNHLMVVLNTQIRIQTRTGAPISTLTLDAFWSALLGPWAGAGPAVFDPKVLYDPYSSRWMFTAVADGEAPTSAVLIAVSQTSDPTGNWKLYKVDADSTNVSWADYPSIGFNKNWIVVTVNMFNTASGNFTRSQILAFNKATLYAFAASPGFKRFFDVNGFTQAPAITYDNLLNTLYLVEDFDGHSQLRIKSISGTAAAPTYPATQFFPTVAAPNFWTFAPNSGNDFAPQSGSPQKIQNNDSRIQNAVYRNGSLWCAQTIFLPDSATPTRSAVQWWELTPTSAVIKQRGRIDDPTAPITFYAFPSIAVNKNNDVLIGFSRFSGGQYASANYAFRAQADPLNTLRTDVVLRAGGAPYYKIFSGIRNRWGDFSSTVVDPNNDLDMWTIQEHAVPASGGFSRWETWWGRVGPSTAAPLLQLGTVTAVDGNAVDADTFIEPGENGNRLTIQLKNIGKAAATGISATLTTSTAGVTITTNTSAYPNLAATTGAGNNVTPFMFNVSSAVLCGQILSFTLNVTYGGGGSVAFPFTINTGRPGAPVAESYAGAAKPIPDNNPAGVNVPLAVSGLAGNISDLNFKIGGTNCAAPPLGVGIDHPWVGDLVLTLKSPQGTVVTLISQAGGVNNNGHNFCNTTLDDEAAGISIQNVTPAQNPYTGSFKPASPLSAFDGKNPNGTWTLNVSDRGSIDTGTLRAFSLIITTYECSTTSFSKPIEVQSDRILASLPAHPDRAPVSPQANMNFFSRSRIFSDLGVGQEKRLSGGLTPSETFRSGVVSKHYGNLLRLLTG